MPYRFELSPSNRAGCQTKECKDNKVKITKGELRVGSWVDTERVQYWAWRHWGCTTPLVLSNIQTSIADEEDDSELNFEALDGFDELPSEFQEKIKVAIEKGHIEDDEWKGDVAHNRPGMRGMFPRKSRAKAVSETPSPKKANSAPTEAVETETSDEGKKGKATKPKRKANSKASVEPKGEDEAKATDKAPSDEKPARKRKNAAAAAAEEATADAPINGDDNKEEDEPAPKRKRATRAKKAVTELEADKNTEAEKGGRTAKNAAKPKAKGGRTKKPTQEKDTEEKTVDNTEKPKRGRRKAARRQQAAQDN
ncbi:hypothetical protein N7533_007244 [Penicillium manginii]|uniref:uncharacterized protein n=1 Tax=Penicillium manginii TaxID=203109 RepID=UPI002546621B|nr:uncharacterized protein N7533_007244 [Penicillium manginii]KAJ5750216.1 hypothetical protein N7533_007244 [Penicillium manginii]